MIPGNNLCVAGLERSDRSHSQLSGHNVTSSRWRGSQQVGCQIQGGCHSDISSCTSTFLLNSSWVVMTDKGGLEVEGPLLRGSVGAGAERQNTLRTRKEMPRGYLPRGRKDWKSNCHWDQRVSKISNLLKVTFCFFCLEGIFGWGDHSFPKGRQASRGWWRWMGPVSYGQRQVWILTLSLEGVILDKCMFNVFVYLSSHL